MSFYKVSLMSILVKIYKENISEVFLDIANLTKTKEYDKRNSD